MAQGELAELASRLGPVFARHRVLRAIVFGSLARGEASRRSDLDLIVVQDTQKRFLDRYDDLLREITQAVPGRDVDLLIYTPDELAAMVERRFIATALREGKVIYESVQEPLSS
jgi:predicted nucleotidyltransferase